VADAQGGDLFIRYGPWSLRTPLSNISGAELTGPYNLVKVAGPPHVSLADRGLSFATATDRGLCISFERAVAAVEPLGLLRHPAVTVTITELEHLHRLISLDRGSPGSPGLAAP